MYTNSEQRRALILIFSLTAFAFIILLMFLILVWLLFRRLGSPGDLWAMTEALSTALGVAAVLGGGYVAYRQLAELASSRHLEIADRLFDELNSQENIEARRWVFQNLQDASGEDIRKLSPEGRQAIKRVLNSFDKVAFLTQPGWIPEEMVMPWMNPMIVKSWAKLEKIVDYECERRNEPDYYEHARELAGRCRAWRAKNLPGAEITWVDDAL